MRIFMGDDGKLLFFWRAVIFVGLGFALQFALRPLAGVVFTRLHLTLSLSPAIVTLVEAQNFIIALVPTVLFALYEHRSFGSYGLPIARALGWHTWEGLAVGVVMAGLVAIGMIALGGMQVHGLALAGNALLLFTLAWIGTNILVGLAEEMWFRGYFLRALWRSIGFWPASIVIASLFAALHYFEKPQENIWDVITLIAFSLLCTYSVLKTGTLWFAVGLHAAFDFMQLFVIGTPNGTQIPVGRLLNVTFNGHAWLTGGVLGTEASWLMYPVFVLAFLYVALRYRGQSLTEP